MDLKGIPDVELRAELGRRAEETRLRQLAEQAVEGALLKKHVKILLEFAPKHSRTSCSDNDANNDDRGCTRCQLLRVERTEDWDDKFYFTVSSISLASIP